MPNRFEDLTNMDIRHSVPHGAPTNTAKELAPAGVQRNASAAVRLDRIDPSEWPMTTKSIEILAALTEKIGEGTFREVYRYNNFAIKTTKSHFTKKFLFIEVLVPTSLYILITYGIRNLSEYEYKQYQSIISKVPPDLHTCFAKVYKPLSVNKACYSINQLVIDDDGQLSKTIAEYGKVSDDHFWSVIDELETLFIEKHIYYFGIGAFNVCVKLHADGRIIPVLIDYKRIGIRTFWHQLLLHFPYFMKLKIRRRFQEMREKHRDFVRSV